MLPNRAVGQSNTRAAGCAAGLAPALTPGPGSWSGSVTACNITPLHLFDITRIGEAVGPHVDPLRAITRRVLGGTLPLARRPRHVWCPPLPAGEVHRAASLGILDR